MNTDTTGTFLGIPFNRIVAFLGPYVAVASGAVATWLLTHLHVLLMLHLTDHQVATAISQLTVFGITAGLTWLGHHKWLTGHQIQLQTAVTAASERTAAPVVNGTRPAAHTADLASVDGFDRNVAV